jgi:serine/threonine protein kinase/tetratricopeptide (TPR) repeat protein
MHTLIGRTISHYRIVKKLGAGGVGVVYKAEDTRLKRTVALKFLLPHVLGSRDARARLIREAQAAAALKHPNICIVYEIDEIDGQTFIAMDCVEGVSLTEMLRSGRMDQDTALNIIAQVAAGLQAAHEKEIVHRDIKPANIMVTPGGEVEILDFGLARSADQSRITKAGTPVGTLVYMSPEQARGDEVDHRTDIWSLGVVLYEMLTGRLPFRGAGEQAVVYSILNQAPEPIASLRPGLPKAIDRAVAKALAKSPDERYQRIEDLLADLGLSQSGFRLVRAGRRLPRARRPARWPAFGFLVAAGIVLMGLTLVYLLSRPRPPALGMRSVAVLPLETIPADPDNEWLCNGITEDIITHLAKIGNLRVIARSSAMRYRQSELAPARIAGELGVASLLQGSIQLHDEQMRINVQLVNPRTNTHLWAESFDPQGTDLFAVQSEIALAVARALEAQLSPEQEVRVGRAPTDNMEAYQLCLMGGHYRWQGTAEGLRKSLAYFHQAIDLDSTYAMAYAGIGAYYTTLTFRDYVSPHEGWPKARASAEQALRLDPDLPEAYWVLGLCRGFYEWDWQAAEKACQRGLQLAPSSVPCHAGYSLLLIAMGRAADAVAEAGRARELDPISPACLHNYAMLLIAAQRHGQAIEEYRRLLESDPTYWVAHNWLAYAYSKRGMHREAIAHARRASELAEGTSILPRTILGFALANGGMEAEALEILEELQGLAQTRYVSAYRIGQILLSLGRIDEAFVWFEKACGARDQWLTAGLSGASGTLTPVRHDPRLRKLQERMGLSWLGK